MPISRRAWLFGTAGALALGAGAASLPGGGPRAYFGGIAPRTDFAPFGTVFEPQELRAELSWLAATMREVGAKPFTFSSEAAFDAAYLRTLAGLDRPMSAAGFYLAAAPLFAALNDGHVSINLGREYDSWRDERGGKAFPLSVKFTSYGMFVDLETDERLPSGTRIESIDGIRASELVRSIERLQGAQTSEIRSALVDDYQVRQLF